MIASLAHRKGQQIPTITVNDNSDDLFTVALHNATEGCIFETWAALEAGLKAQHASTEELKEIYASIANDEVRHAQLAWDLHSWLMEQLSLEQRQQIYKAQRAAIAKLQETAIAQLQATPTELGLHNLSDPGSIVERFVQKIVA